MALRTWLFRAFLPSRAGLVALILRLLFVLVTWHLFSRVHEGWFNSEVARWGYFLDQGAPMSAVAVQRIFSLMPKSASIAIPLLALGMWLLHELIIVGAVFGLLNSDKGVLLESLRRGSALLPAFFRLGIIALLLGGVVQAALIVAIRNFNEDGLADGSLNMLGSVENGLLAAGLSLAWWTLVGGVVALAKVFLVHEGTGKVVGSLWRAAKVFVRLPVTYYAFFALLTITSSSLSSWALVTWRQGSQNANIWYLVLGVHSVMWIILWQGIVGFWRGVQGPVEQGD